MYFRRLRLTYHAIVALIKPMPDMHTTTSPNDALPESTATEAARLARRSERMRVVLLGVVIVSLVVHVLAAIGVSTQPIGYISLEDLLATREPVRIKRAPSDVYRPGPTEDVGQGDARPDLAAMSEALLEEKTILPEQPQEMPVDVRQFELQEAVPQVSPALVEETEFELSDDALAALQTGQPEELTVGDVTGPGGDGTGLGVGPPGGGPTEGTRAQAAAQLDMPGFVSQTAPGPIETAVPDALLPQPGTLEQTVDLPLQAVPLDFTELALRDTEQLDIPEHLDDDFDYYVTKRPGAGSQPGWFQVEIVPRRTLRRLKTMPKDVVFVIDTSASIPQDWVQQMVNGVKFALGSLNAVDRFNIMLFDERPKLFSNQIVDATATNLNRAVRFLDSAESQGATDVNSALSRLLVRDGSQDRVYNLVLISDGLPTRGVMDTRDLINIITRENALEASIYCVGVTERANRQLLDFLAYRNKGFSIFIDDRRRAATQIRDLMSRLRYPLIKNVRLNVAGVDAEQVYPKDLPNIHQSERFQIFGRYENEGVFTVRITGRTVGQPVDFTFTRNLAEASRGGPEIPRDWAFWKLHHLYGQIILQGERPTLMQQIEELRQQYGLKTLY